jgi:F-type H+-transporting ATPase subunit epsilon
MAETIHLDLVTPDRRLISAEVEQVVAEGVLGEFNVLPGHANFITLLAPGELSFTQGGKKKSVAVCGGFAEVTLKHGVRVMAEAAEFAEEIDRERARAAKERAEKRIAGYEPDSDINLERAEIALKRALLRLQVAGKAGN